MISEDKKLLEQKYKECITILTDIEKKIKKITLKEIENYRLILEKSAKMLTEQVKIIENNLKIFDTNIKNNQNQR